MVGRRTCNLIKPPTENPGLMSDYNGVDVIGVHQKLEVENDVDLVGFMEEVGALSGKVTQEALDGLCVFVWPYGNLNVHFGMLLSGLCRSVM